MKLALELSKRDTGRTLYILDEPTTGLHFHDIEMLLTVLHRLRDHGNTVVVIEHNLDVLKTADWIIDLGPEGGGGGGRIIAEGPPEEIVKVAASHTGRYLRPVLDAHAARRARDASSGGDRTRPVRTRAQGVGRLCSAKKVGSDSTFHEAPQRDRTRKVESDPTFSRHPPPRSGAARRGSGRGDGGPARDAAARRCRACRIRTRPRRTRMDARHLRALSVWLAVDDGRVIGIASRDGEWVSQLYIAPERTGRGIGQRLLDALLAEAASRRSPCSSCGRFSAMRARAASTSAMASLAVEFGDGAGNEENEPDVRYERAIGTRSAQG